MAREKIAKDLAENGLKCINQTYAWAKAQSERGFTPPSIMNANAGTNAKVHEKHRLEYDKNKISLQAMLSTPVLARVKYTDDDEKEQEVYIVRGSNPTGLPFRTASNNSPLAGLASLKPGDGELLVIEKKEHDLLVSEVVIFRPTRDKNNYDWDSIDTRVESEVDGVFSIPSLLHFGLKKPKLAHDPWAENEQSYDLIDGFRREIQTGFGLREQPIPDRIQRDVTRLPLNVACFLSGPAGTGKTTTLVRRLGQMTDLEYNDDPTELSFIKKVELDTGRPHNVSWIMFSPTDLLKEFVKEAFAREGQAAPSERLRTWSSFRREIARDTLKLIRSSNRRSGFILASDSSYIKTTPDEIIVWYEDFEKFRRNRDQDIVIKAAKLLSSSESTDVAHLALQINNVIGSFDNPSQVDLLSGLKVFSERLQVIEKILNSEITETITKRLTMSVNKDPDFPKKLVDQIVEIRDRATEDNEDDEVEIEDNTDDSSMQITKARARGNTVRYIRNLAFSLAKGRLPNPNSAASQLMNWLGPERRPSEDEITNIGYKERELRAVRALLRQDRNFLARLRATYRVYRKASLKDKNYYIRMPQKPSYIAPVELDILILTALKTLREMDQFHGEIGEERRSFLRAQVFIDEATDFTPVQLAAMRELTHPESGAFFMTGDLNQRLQSNGLQSLEALNWVGNDIRHYGLNVSYRQSQNLLTLGSAVADLGKFKNAGASYAGYNEDNSPKPEWKSFLSDRENLATWLTEKITFVDKAGGERRISIAIFVPNSEIAEDLTMRLSSKLLETGREVVNCSNKNTAVTEVQQVGIYDIAHIKGLEFEAVFLVDIDVIMDRDPDLALTTLYVGVTRAASYLAVTFKAKRPEMLNSLNSHFDGD